VKLLTVFLAFYIILLACKPCADGETLSVNQKQTASKTTGHSQDHHEDSCSPFCICSCCGVQILNFSQPVAYQFVKAFADIKTPVPSYKSALISGYFGSVWQPPQIA